MPTTTPRRPLVLTDSQCEHAHNLYAAAYNGPAAYRLTLVRSYVEQVTGRTDLTDAQLLVAVGTHGWRAGTSYGDQSYQQRMTRLGRSMRRLGTRGSLAGITGATTPTARRFGIEIEFNNPNGGSYHSSTAATMRREIVADMCGRGISSYEDMVYGHRTPTEWKMTYDQTTTGGEFVSPILTADSTGHHQVREALRAVKAAGGVGGREQGMHIHHDVTDFTATEMAGLVANLRHAETALLSYVPAYRYESGRWAPRVGDYNWNRCLRDAQAGSLVPGRNARARDYYNRYVAFNFSAVLVQGSVEFRALGNTLNPIKVWTWITVGSALIAWTKAGHTLVREVTAEELVSYLVTDGFLDATEGDRFTTEVARRTGRAAA